MFRKKKDKKENIENIEEVSVPEEGNVKEIIVERRVGFNFSEVIIIMIIAIMFGFLLGNIINFVVFDKSGEDDELKELVSTYDNIINNYYEDVDKEELIDAGIQGMINYLDDPYATYFSGQASDDFNEELAGTYEGIGVEVMMKDNVISISKVFDGSSAKKEGLEVGDIILQVNDTDVSGKTLSEVVEMISGEDSSKNVKLTIKRGEQKLEFNVSKGTIDMPVVTSEIFTSNNKKIGYLKIEIFSLNSYEQFNSKLKELEKEGIEGLVIDVRDNPGGYLSQVKDILCLFLDKKQILYQLETKTDKEVVYGTSKSIDRDYPVSIIINDDSASAAEILASAFKESYGSRIVGINSYGKGTVQAASDLNSGDTIKYTVQKWLTPLGNWVNDVGVVPTDRVETVLHDGETLTYDNDTMLQTALSVVSE
ncbi:MAG TPA: S41 family peptidase [Candidatus Onthousia faecavium]|nr:S41 family peptidase [Candidatus Onthousia faecavium]